MYASLRCRSIWDGPRKPAAPADFLLRLPGEARQAKAAGAGALEFEGDLVAIDDAFADRALWEHAARALAAEGVRATVHLPSVWVDIAALDGEVWEGSVRSVERALSAMEPLDAAMAAVHPANFGAQALLLGTPESAQASVMMALAQRLLAALARLKAAPGGERLALENLESVPWPLFAQIAEMADVHVCLDVGHAISNGDDPAAALRDIAPRLLGVHLHDATPPAAGQRVGRAHLPLGSGRLDVDGVAAGLKAAGFEGPVVLEVDGASLERWLAAVRSTSAANP